MKRIIVKWVKEENNNPMYDMAMLVISSTHERFVAGSRFDFGFFNIATKEGYEIVSLPMDDEKRKP